jgi:hypothetical protein
MTIRRGPGRPALPEDERRGSVTFRCAPRTLLAIDEAADREGLSRSDWIVGAIEHALESSSAESRLPVLSIEIKGGFIVHDANAKAEPFGPLAGRQPWPKWYEPEAGTTYHRHERVRDGARWFVYVPMYLDADAVLNAAGFARAPAP